MSAKLFLLVALCVLCALITRTDAQYYYPYSYYGGYGYGYGYPYSYGYGYYPYYGYYGKREAGFAAAKKALIKI